MRFLLIISTICFTSFLVAQSNITKECPFNLKIDTLVWEGTSVTIKLKVQPNPVNGYFDIYRKCLSIPQDKNTYVGFIDVSHKILEFPDSKSDLKRPYSYLYRVEFRDNKRCVSVKQTTGRAIEDN